MHGSPTYSRAKRCWQTAVYIVGTRSLHTGMDNSADVADPPFPYRWECRIGGDPAIGGGWPVRRLIAPGDYITRLHIPDDAIRWQTAYGPRWDS
jgi:hypothetical protein